jgi:hypothetical protein
MSVLFVFLDGVGIGSSDPDRNPFLQAHLPGLEKLLGGRMPTLDDPSVQGPAGRAFPLDANLNVEGIPQSGTGQISLMTGDNAAVAFGRHFGPWAPVRLRPLLIERNLLRTALDSGHSAAFANAYPEGYLERAGSRFPAAPPLAADAAGLLCRHAAELALGDAVSSEIVNTGWRDKLGHSEVPRITPREAGANLARIAASVDLTFYAHYTTDSAGHKGSAGEAIMALERVDEFLSGVVDGLVEGDSLVVASDHGNLEDLTGGHTRNPVLGLLAGAATAADRLPTSILGDATEAPGGTPGSLWKTQGPRPEGSPDGTGRIDQPRLGDLLVARGYVDDVAVVRTLAAQLGLPFAEGPLTPDPDAIGLIDAPFARSRTVLPLSARNRTLRLAVSDPLDQVTLDEARFSTGRHVEVSVATASALVEAIRTSYGEDFADLVDGLPDAESTVEAQALHTVAEAAPVVQLVNHLLHEAAALGAATFTWSPRKENSSCAGGLTAYSATR